MLYHEPSRWKMESFQIHFIAITIYIMLILPLTILYAWLHYYIIALFIILASSVLQLESFNLY